MASELEGLIAGLLLRISLTGEQGCLVSDLLGSIESSSGNGQNVYDASTEAHPSPEHHPPAPSQRTCTIWNWLSARKDVSIGSDRAYNHLTLNQLLALPQSRDEPAKPDDEGSASESNSIRVYASEETMWESLTGHSVDYKRVPKSEWMLLQGIASTISGGILQGDLGRLVDQDKRSVPKRTDALLKKGYIVKRTTLVRGTKTSKMWLKGLAPPLPKDGDPADEASGPAMTMTRQVLADNLDPVPWHIRWTGESVDYIALATTIMAVAKEWGVLRMLHLKSKLGILSMRWQMKVLAKTCRFLNSRGVIRYVAAKLGDKVYKDCIKFTRDLSPEDWSLFLATGKRQKRPAPISGSADDLDVIDPLLLQSANTSELTSAPPWSVDKPLSATIVEIAERFGEAGLTNPDVYGLTLGSTFSRFLSTLTAAIATPTLQPPRLAHLQLRCEHTRAGKVASYRYFAQTPPGASHEGPTESSSEWKEGDYSTYGFAPVSSSMKTSTSSAALAGLMAQSASARQKGRGRPPGRKNLKRTAPKISIPTTELRRGTADASPTLPANDESSVSAAASEPGEPNGIEPPASSLQSSAEEPIDQTKVSKPARPTRTRKTATGTTNEDQNSTIVEPPVKRRKRDDNAVRPWKCDKCGNSWKNDIGLKYHLEKSRTSCNPSFNAFESTPRRGRKRARPQTPDSVAIPSATPVVIDLVEPPEAESNQREDNGEAETEVLAPKSSQVIPTPTTEEAPESEPHISVAESRAQAPPEGPGISVPVSATNHGVLVESEESRPRPLPALSDRPQWEPAQKARGAERASQPPGSNPRPNGGEPLALSTPTPVEATQPMQSISSTPADGQPTSGVKQAEEDRGLEGLPDSSSTYPEISRSTPEPIRDISGEATAGTSESALPSALSRSTLLSRVGEIISQLIGDQNGVFPGGKALWFAITAIWSEKFPNDPPPNTKVCQSGLRALLNQKAIREHWHGFRDEKGMFAKCQIIIAPSIPAFSPEVVDVLARIKEAHPQLYLPPPFVAPALKDRRSRRPLPNEVETLDAPVYVAQSTPTSTKRPVEEEYCEPPPKRPRGRPPRRKDHQSSAHVALSAHEQGFSQWLAGKQKEAPERRPWYAPFSAGSRRKPAAIHFLKPNTRLLEEEPAGLLTRPPPNTVEDFPCENHQNEEQQLGEAVEVKFVGDTLRIDGANRSWPDLSPEYFEEGDCSFTISGWMPDTTWFFWESIMSDFDKRIIAGGNRRLKTGRRERQRFIKSLVACIELEGSWVKLFTSSQAHMAGLHNIFIRFFGGATREVPIPYPLTWPEDGQLTTQSIQARQGGNGPVLSWDEELNLFNWVEVRGRHTRAKRGELEPVEGSPLRPEPPQTPRPLQPLQPRQPLQPLQPLQSTQSTHSTQPPQSHRTPRPRRAARALGHSQPESTQSPSIVKRVALVTRSLTSFPEPQETVVDTPVDYGVEEPDRLLAAFVAVRVLLGGYEKAIDWALLLRIFPDLGIKTLRRFWLTARKEQRTHINELTKEFQDRFIEAYERDELPEFDYDDPIDYDWPGLIEWTLQIARKDGIDLPATRNLLNERYSTQDGPPVEDNWQEKFFHVQASVFARFEWATARPAAIATEDISRSELAEPVSDLDVAISWVRSLCLTSQSRQSAQEIKAKFSTLPNPELLRTAIDHLTNQRVICKSKRPLFGGRPYRLNEYYTYMVDKLSQMPKYREAAIFKAKLDSLFRRGKKWKVPFTLDDGSVMAITNMNAAGRIRIVPTNIPYIPFGFEPGNYESRKFPKSYYEFGMEIVPTDAYLYNEDIDVLKSTLHEGPPFGGARGELPQWVDFFGTRIPRQWMSVLGAFCFHYASRGFLTVQGLCTALRPILEEFEARIIIDWGLRTGLLKESSEGFGTMVAEWWWLAVPWQAKWSNGNGVLVD